LTTNNCAEQLSWLFAGEIPKDLTNEMLVEMKPLDIHQFNVALGNVFEVNFVKTLG